MFLGWPPALVVIVLGAGVFLLLFLVRNPLRAAWRNSRTVRAVFAFQALRERLEHEFFNIAASLGTPRGLRWVACDWTPETRFARDRNTGLLTAFVGVNISFEAIEGGDMEEIEAVGTVRDASAVFHFQNGLWGTGGRALFNMHPTSALQRLESQYEPVRLPIELQNRDPRESDRKRTRVPDDE